VSGTSGTAYSCIAETRKEIKTLIRKINLTGKNSNEVYTISFPNNLLGFIKFDFTAFMEKCVDLCRVYQRSGKCSADEMTDTKKSISNCHKYFEQNIHTMFEKIVTDCWIDYLCRQNSTTSAALWNNFLSCRNDFEKTIFARLSEYRHNHGFNQWVNLLRLQEYAIRKIEFVFGEKVKNSKEAIGKANYFDLMFNVAANELGFNLSEISVNKIYPMGRIPNSPFVLNSVSREILRNVISDIPYDSGAKPDKSDHFPDNEAMNAFSVIKNIIPEEPDTISKTLVKSMSEVPPRVYMPVSFKAVIDLEIDALTESGASLQHCERCNEYFVRDEEYDYDYCDTIRAGERLSCLEIIRREQQAETRTGFVNYNPAPAKLSDKSKPAVTASETITPVPQKNSENKLDEDELMRVCDKLYREFASRVNVDITQRDLSEWYRELKVIRDRLFNGQADMQDLNDFISFSRDVRFATRQSFSRANVPPPQKYENKEVKPFVFERVEVPAKKRNSFLEEILDEDKDESGEENTPSYTRQPPVQAPQSRVIRGAVVPQNIAVEIPSSFNTVHLSSQKSEPRHENYETYGKPKTVQDNYTNDYPQDFDEDVKIYRAPKQAVQQPVIDDDIKVFEPAIKNKPIQPRPLRETNAEIFANINNTGIIRENETKSEPRSGYSAYNNYSENIKPAKNIPQYQIYNETPKNNNAFEDILKGFERKDGFEMTGLREEDIPTDADGVPMSHKTKRVLDVIMKPTKPSVFLNAVDVR
jgi:hypothetical protein